jgi:hypothetical protein
MHPTHRPMCDPTFIFIARLPLVFEKKNQYFSKIVSKNIFYGKNETLMHKDTHKIQATC